MTSEESGTTDMMQNLKMEENKETKETENSEEVPPPDGADGNQEESSAKKNQGNQNAQGAQDGEEGNEAGDEKEDEETGKTKEDVKKDNHEEPAPEERTYPGLVGADSMYVKLVSSDNHEFVIRRSLAQVSKVILEMLNGPNAGTDNTVHFRMINSASLSTLCRYLRWQEYYLKNNGEVETFDIEPSESLDLFLLAGYLQI